MSYPVSMYPNDAVAIEAEARVLFGKSADKILAQHGGSARAGEQRDACRSCATRCT